jgi:hypothetical protein
VSPLKAGLQASAVVPPDFAILPRDWPILDRRLRRIRSPVHQARHIAQFDRSEQGVPKTKSGCEIGNAAHPFQCGGIVFS